MLNVILNASYWGTDFSWNQDTYVVPNSFWVLGRLGMWASQLKHSSNIFGMHQWIVACFLTDHLAGLFCFSVQLLYLSFKASALLIPVALLKTLQNWEASISSGLLSFLSLPILPQSPLCKQVVIKPLFTQGSAQLPKYSHEGPLESILPISSCLCKRQALVLCWPALCRHPRHSTMSQTTLDTYIEAAEFSKLNEPGLEGDRSRVRGLASFCCSLHGCCLTEPGSSNPPPRDTVQQPGRALGTSRQKSNKVSALATHFGFAPFTLPRFLVFSPNEVTSLSVCVYRSLLVFLGALTLGEGLGTSPWVSQSWMGFQSFYTWEPWNNVQWKCRPVGMNINLLITFCEGVHEWAFENYRALSFLSHSHHNLLTPWQRLQAVCLRKSAVVALAFSQRGRVEVHAGWDDSWKLWQPP